MKGRETLMLAMLVLGLGIVAGPPADATSVGTVTVDCTGARFQGFLALADMGRLEQRLYLGPDPGYPMVQDDYILLTAPWDFDFTYPWAATPDGWLYRAAFSASSDGGATWFMVAIDEGVLFCLPPPSNEGCSPGYWKNHLEDWPPTGLLPTDDFDETFGVDLFTPDITLEEAVNLKGGGVKKVARHGAAALLSAAHAAVEYPFSVEAVIAAVRAGEVGSLAEANELGCLIP